MAFNNLLPGLDTYPDAPEVIGHKDWVFTGWDREFASGEVIEADATNMTIAATYAEDKNNNTIPDSGEYITVVLKAGEHGSFVIGGTSAVIKEVTYNKLLPDFDKYPDIPDMIVGVDYKIKGMTPEYNSGAVITDTAKTQIFEVTYFEDKGLHVGSVDFGGGLGVDYEAPDASPVAPFETWFRTITGSYCRRPGQSLHFEPGRSVVAQCGTLVTRVLFVKSGETKNFLILDAGMNDLIRPALYGAYHKIENLSSCFRKGFSEMQAYDVVGPVCESSDVWGQGRLLPLSVRGDLMAIRSAGAYGQVMSSRYNLRDFAPAVFSDELDSAPHFIDYFKRL